MRSILVLGALVLLGGACWAQAVATEPLGTLLYSPQERARIAAARASGGQPGEAAPGTPTPTSLLRYHGVVQRQGGKSTVWINGKALPEGDTEAPALQDTQAVVAGQPMRVGQSVDTATGQRQDLVEPGAVVVRRKP
ncbi:MAG: hypothetical protein ACT4NV_18920 [Rhodoferax sp.]